MSEKLEKARLYEIQEAENIPQEEKPAFHVTPPVGWINDPNGFSVFEGKIHLFYQYHPYSRDWGPMHWGHSVTEDMVKWEQLPAALAPDQEYDREGCFSGSAVEVNGKQVLIYTGVTTEKLPDGKEGCRSEEIPGQVVLFSSPDLEEWKFETILAENTTGEIGVMWECPDFFPLGEKHVLICSPQNMQAKGYEIHNGHNSVYFVGDYDSEKHIFQKEPPVSLDYGLDFYAPQTTQLPDGRRVMIAWMKSWDNCVIPEKQRWQGMMTLPRELTFREGKIWQKPVREIENYRKNPRSYDNVEVGDKLSLEGIRGRMIDLTVELKLTDPQEPAADGYDEFQIELAKNDKYTTLFTYNRKKQILEIDRTWSGVCRDVVCTRKIQITDEKQVLKLRFIMDRSCIELFINDGSKTAATAIPTPAEAEEILFHSDGKAVISVEKYDIVL